MGVIHIRKAGSAYLEKRMLVKRKRRFSDGRRESDWPVKEADGRGKEFGSMRDHTVRLLKECDSGCKMAVSSMEQVLSYVSDEKLKKTIEDYEKKHQNLEYEAFKQLESLDESGKEPDKMASVFSKISTDMKMMMKGDDKEAARIMTDGCNMGIQSICKYKNQYVGASKESMELADRLVQTEEAFRDAMKVYL